MNIEMHVSLSILLSSVCMPNQGTTGSFGSSSSSSLKYLHTLLHSGDASLDSHLQCRSLPIIHTLSRIYCLNFLMAAVLASKSRHVIVGLICISLIMREVEHLFMSLLAIYVSSLDKRLLSFLARFFIQSFIFQALSFMVCFYILWVNSCQWLCLLLFSPFQRVLFHIAYSFLDCTIAFKFHLIPNVYFCFLSIPLGGGSQSILL